jgi:hypothetical protein
VKKHETAIPLERAVNEVEMAEEDEQQSADDSELSEDEEDEDAEVLFTERSSAELRAEISRLGDYGWHRRARVSQASDEEVKEEGQTRCFDAK